MTRTASQPYQREYHSSTAADLLGAAALKLSRNRWWADEWSFSVHQYPPHPAQAESITLHVFRPGWFNEDHQGIHFETFLGPKEWKARKLPIMMHILHCPKVPGTTIERRAVARPFIDASYELISGWAGYQFRAGKYGTHPFTCMLSFEIHTFPEQVEREFARLCLQLGPIMDKTLDSVLKVP